MTTPDRAQAMARLFRTLSAYGAEPTLAAAVATGRVPIKTSGITNAAGHAIPSIPETKQAYEERMTAERLYDRELHKRKKAGLPSGLTTKQI